MLATLLACLAVPLPAQDAPRVRTPIQVVDAAGKPWIGAEVRVVSNVFAGIVPDHEGKFDRWTDSASAKTDERGRVVLRLLRGRRYTAWAAAAIDGDRYRVTSAVDGISAGAGGELREAGSYWRERVRIVGADAWKQHGFELRVESPGEMTVVTRSTKPESNEVTLPMFPTSRTSAWTRLFTKDGRLLASRQTVPQAVHVARPAHRELRVYPPASLLIRVTSPDGKPIAGARLLSVTHNHWSALATTGANGNALVRMPLRSTTRSRRLGLSFILKADGYATAQPRVSVTISPKPRDEAKLVEAGRPDVTIVAVAQRVVRGRVLMSDGKPAVGMPIATGTSLPRGASTPGRLLRPLFTATDADGRFEVRGLGTRSAWRVLAVPSAEQLSELGGRKTIAPVVWLGGANAGTEDVDLGEIRFDQLARVDLQIKNHIGEPARGADVLLAEPGAYNKLDQGIEPPVPLVADRVGRLRLLVHRHGQPAIGAHRAGGTAYAELPRNGKPLEVTLSPTVMVTGQITGATIDYAGSTLTAYVQSRNVRAHDWLWGRLPYRWYLPVGADGKFQVPVPADSKIRITVATRQHAGKRWSGSATLQTGLGHPEAARDQGRPEGVPRRAQDDGHGRPTGRPWQRHRAPPEARAGQEGQEGPVVAEKTASLTRDSRRE